jgi:fructan beta-fructosidase
MQYFVGIFDGLNFHNDNPPDTILWQNWGQDYYAGITWENIPADDGRRIMIAWADNWLYRFDIPTTPFNGQLTVPRELRLVTTPDGIRMTARPVREVETLRGEPLDHAITIATPDPQPIISVDGPHEVLVEFDCANATAREFGIDVHAGPTEFTRIGYNPSRGLAFVDRQHAGVTPSPFFAGRHEAPIPALSDRLRLRVLVDTSSVEVFVDDREQFTNLVLPSDDSNGLRPFAHDGSALVTSMTIYPLASIWPDRPDLVARVGSGEWATSVSGVQGSSSELGVAVPAWPTDSGDSETYNITLVGTRDGNPGKVLGQIAAGIVLDADIDHGRGLAIVLDNAGRRMVVHDLSRSAKILAELPADIVPNTNHQLCVTNADGLLTVILDDAKPWSTAIAWRTERQPTALLVNNAEALFAQSRSHPPLTRSREDSVDD